MNKNVIVLFEVTVRDGKMDGFAAQRLHAFQRLARKRAQGLAQRVHPHFNGRGAKPAKARAQRLDHGFFGRENARGGLRAALVDARVFRWRKNARAKVRLFASLRNAANFYQIEAQSKHHARFSPSRIFLYYSTRDTNRAKDFHSKACKTCEILL